MSKIIDTILQAQTLVRQAESGRIPWETALDAAFDQGHLDPSDLYTFVAGVYARFRIAEAGAYHFKQGTEGFPHTGVRNLLATCDILKADIFQVLRDSESHRATTPAEEVAKLWVEEKLKWALSIINDSVPAWGY